MNGRLFARARLSHFSGGRENSSADWAASFRLNFRQAAAPGHVVPERPAAGRHLPADLRGHREERAHRQGRRKKATAVQEITFSTPEVDYRVAGLKFMLSLLMAYKRRGVF